MGIFPMSRKCKFFGTVINFSLGEDISVLE